MENINSIGKRIREKREECGLTLEELSAYTGTSRQTISRYETGAIKSIPYDRVEIIASVLSTTPGYLMGWEEHADAPLTRDAIAYRLKLARIAAGLSRACVAETINRNVKIIGHWETGYASPDIETLLTLLDLYKVDLNTFFSVSVKKDAPINTRSAKALLRAEVDGMTEEQAAIFLAALQAAKLIYKA